jgi:hypothetical protein
VKDSQADEKETKYSNNPNPTEAKKSLHCHLLGKKWGRSVGFIISFNIFFLFCNLVSLGFRIKLTT